MASLPTNTLSILVFLFLLVITSVSDGVAYIKKKVRGRSDEDA